MQTMTQSERMRNYYRLKAIREGRQPLTPEQQRERDAEKRRQRARDRYWRERGTTKSPVEERMDRADALCTSGSVDERAMVYRLLCSNLTDEAIAKLTGLAEEQVAKYRKQMPKWWRRDIEGLMNRKGPMNKTKERK